MKILVLTLLAASTFAQPTPAPASPPLRSGEEIRVVEVKNAHAESIQNTLTALFSGTTISNGKLVVRGDKAVVDMIEAAIHKLDVAPKPPPESQPMPNVELTVHLLQGLAQADAGTSIPPVLESTVRQLRNNFSYKGYKVLDTFVLRGRSGGGQEMTMGGPLPALSAIVNFRALADSVTGPSPHLVRLRRMFLHLRAVTGAWSVEIASDIDAREDQKTVVGKANLSGTDDAIFLVITPRVVD
jgi:hypothetical protein